MFDKLEEVVSRFQEVEAKLGDPDLANRQDEFRRLTREHSDLSELVQEYQSYKSKKQELAGNQELLSEGDPEMVEMAKEEIRRLEEEISESESKLQVLLLPKDPNDGKNAILEIRAGAGGDEAALFAGDLFRLYHKYGEKIGWRFEMLSSNEIGIGGYKEIICMITGDSVFSHLKWESGVHRVQRVPDTESQGRIHTSTVTVAVLPEVEEVEININPADLRIDVYRASGAGGQHVNTTDSAVRITHIPSGVVVTCQDERSQHKNKDKAMKILRSRLYEFEEEKNAKEHSDARKSMVGTGDRSERIRTYNYPQGRLTDHRIGLTLYSLPEIMEGDLNQVVSQLRTHYQTEALKSQGIGS
ncbi:MAG: peptide chain release factor 1 [Bdellovibrionaceae bacterium]|nr:peptide chain release factor 1 [Pseudobdellovibrionaceae bacterium]